MSSGSRILIIDNILARTKSLGIETSLIRAIITALIVSSERTIERMCVIS